MIPALGHIKLQKLTAEHVQAFLAEKQGQLKPSMIGYIRSVLSSALEERHEMGVYCVRTLLNWLMFLTAERYEGQVLTVEQARKLLEVARGSRLDALLLVAVTTAMRQGELVALRWSDVDLEKGILQVRHNLAWVRGMGYVEGEPKSKKGRRKIALSGPVIEAIEGA